MGSTLVKPKEKRFGVEGSDGVPLIQRTVHFFKGHDEELIDTYGVLEGKPPAMDRHRIFNKVRRLTEE